MVTRAVDAAADSSVAVRVRAPVGSIDWGFVLRGFALTSWFVLWSLGPVRFFVTHPEGRWPDAHIYYRATAAWIEGGDPWAASFGGIPFAAPPPALLLNLPLLPFGEEAATAFWVIAGTVAALLLLRRFHLPPWWLLFYPIVDAWVGASPDLVLTSLVAVGAGGIAALTKPYSIPALLSENRWRAVAVGAALVVATIPLLPWDQFIEARPRIGSAFEDWARPNSSWGAPLLMGASLIALIALGRRRGLGLVTPAILGQQPHYALFSMNVISESWLLAVFITIPVFGAAAVGVILYAVQDAILSARRRKE